MQTVIEDNITISFDSRNQEVEGFYELLLNKIPIKSAGQHRYIVNRNALNILEAKSIKYTRLA